MRVSGHDSDNRRKKSFAQSIAARKMNTGWIHDRLNYASTIPAHGYYARIFTAEQAWLFLKKGFHYSTGQVLQSSPVVSRGILQSIITRIFHKHAWLSLRIIQDNKTSACFHVSVRKISINIKIAFPIRKLNVLTCAAWLNDQRRWNSVIRGEHLNPVDLWRPLGHNSLKIMKFIVKRGFA